jgi:hypothetical protein
MRDLRDLPPKPINVLLCHHHPIEYAEFDEADRSTIVGGALVLKALQSGDYGPWLVVHGHKHVAHLAYAPGAGASPVLFSAGSVSAYLSGPQSERASNQFYVIEFDEMAAAHIPAQMAARFRSWSWVSGDGWKPSLPGAGLPSHGGFGIRVDPRRTAKDIADALVRAGRKALTWQELVSARPEVEFLIPDDLSLVATELERAGYGVQRASDGRYDEVRSPLDCAR